MIAPELSKIDASNLGAGMEETLGLKGAKSAPQDVDLSHVGVVLDVGGGGFATYRVINSVDSVRSVAAVVTQTIHPIGPAGFTSGGIDAIETTAKENCRVLALNMNLDFDVAGLAAFVGKVLVFIAQISTPGSTAFSTLFHVRYTVAGVGSNSHTQRLVPPGGALPFLVPHGVPLRVRVYVEDGTAFPANTVLTTAVVALATKAGRECPL